MRVTWLGLVATGCYAAHPATGSPCSVDKTCPSGLQCIQDLCLEPGTMIGDAQVPDSPVVRDSSPLDAAIGSPDALVDLTLVAHWEFEDDPTNGTLDSTGHGHTGTCLTTCPTVVAGRIGNGYHFLGSSSQALTVPDSLDFRGPYTIAGWLRPDTSAATGALAMLSKPAGTASDNSWQLEILTNNTLSLSGGTPHTLAGATVLTPMVWHHVAGTWDGTTKRLYVDGVLLAQVAATVQYDTHKVYLGADENSATPVEFFNGILDDLRIYNRVLPAPEIASLAAP